MVKPQVEEFSLNGILDAIDNAIARRRVLVQVLRDRSRVGVPIAVYDFVRSKRSIVDGLAKVELVFFLPFTRKVQFGTAIIGGDLELTINVWAMPLAAEHRGIVLVSSNKRLVDGVERCEVHVVAPVSKSQDGVVW